MRRLRVANGRQHERQAMLEQRGPDAEIGNEDHDGNSEHRQNHMAHMRKGLGVAQILFRLGKLFRLTTQRFATRVGIPLNTFRRHVP